MAPVVDFRDAEVRIGGRRVLGSITLAVGSGERWAVLGANGSGKTTLLRLAGALRHPSGGSVTVLGRRLGHVDVRALRQRIAFVSHAVADAMSPTMPVREVVLTGRRSTLVPWLQRFDDADRIRCNELLARFECSHLSDQAFLTCSQGERQRVLLARALFGRPELLLLDEPAAGLDLPGREALIAALESPGELGGVTTILVTHHMEELPATVTHAVLLRDGRIISAGPIGSVLVDSLVGKCFGMPVTVARRNGRWSAVSSADPSP